MPKSIARKRTTSTKLDVQNALLKLLNDGKKLEEISIKDICTEAGIFRTTFYRYYADIYSCYKDIETRLLNFILDEIKGQLSNNFDRFLPFALFDFIDKNSNVALVILTSPGHDTLLDRVFEEIKKLYMSPSFPMKNVFDDEAMYQFVFGGVKEIVYRWLKDGKKEKAEMVNAKVESLCQSFIKSKVSSN